MKKTLKELDSDLEFLISEKRNFIHIQSQNSSTLKIESYDSIQKIFYTNEKGSMSKVFSIVKKLKLELQYFISEINNYMIGKEHEYFFNNNELGDFCSKKIYNIDLSSAYLTALKNSGMISDKIFNEIFDLEKKQRLICLGLLAYEPIHFFYENGVLIEEKTQVQKNEFRNFFFYCVYEVSQLMKKLINISRDNFIFCWVDGIYFFENDFLRDILEFEIKESGYNCKFEELEFFTSENFENFDRFKYWKENKEKSICVPNNRFLTQKRKYSQFQKFIEKNNFDNAQKFFKFE